jgi:hypothetical protein
MPPQLDISKLSPHLFWDTDATKLNLEQHSRYIIVRVVERGTCDDIRMIFHAYSRARICDALLHARDLNQRTISFFANLFELPQSDFRGYQKRVCA